MTLIERRNSMEYFRDQAADHFARHTGSHWHPRSGSMVNHRAMTSAVIDSRDFLAAKRRAETEVLLPAGPKIAFTGGLDFTMSARSGTSSIRSTPSIRTWCCCMAVRRRAPSVLPPAGPTTAKFHKSPSSPIGPNMPRQHLSSATISCSTCCRSASWCSPHRHSGEHGRQGAEARHSRLEIRQRRRVSATVSHLNCYPSSLQSGNFRSAPQQRPGRAPSRLVPT